MPPEYRITSETAALLDKTVELKESYLAPDSRRQYRTGNNHFVKFVKEFCPNLRLLLRDADWSLFIQYLKNKSLPAGTVLNYVRHVSYMQEDLGFGEVNWHRFTSSIRIRKKLVKLKEARRSKKLPITWNIGCDIAENTSTEDHDELLFVTVMLTGIAGLFRLGELVPKSMKKLDPVRILRKGNLKFYTEGARAGQARI